MDTKNCVLELGTILVSRRACNAVSRDEIAAALVRHVRGDWGDVAELEARYNDLAARDGFWVLSVYHTSAGEEFWVVTDADRSNTTVLMPDEPIRWIGKRAS